MMLFRKMHSKPVMWLVQMSQLTF